MLTLKGTYENGVVTLEKPLKSDRKMPVIVTFLDEDQQQKALSLENFSFRKTREKTRQYSFSLSDAVIEERRDAE